MRNNRIRAAVEAAGGPTRVANQLGVSGRAVYYWIENQRVSRYEDAKKLAKLSGFTIQELRTTPLGRCGL